MITFWLFNKKNRFCHWIAFVLFFLTSAIWIYGKFFVKPESIAFLTPSPIPPEAEQTPDHSGSQPSNKLPAVQIIQSKSPVMIEPEKYDPEKDAWDRGDRTKNFDTFQTRLVEVLSDTYGEGFSRDLSYAILKMLREGKGNEKDTRETIAKFLGKDATAEKIEEIDQALKKAVGSIANNPS